MDRKRVRLSALSVGVVGVLVAGCTSFGQTSPAPTVTVTQGAPSSPPSQPTLDEQAKRAQSAVVRVTETTCKGGATGSGFLIDPTHVVTVGHAVKGSTWTVVRGIDGQLAQAIVLGRDDKREVAYLELTRRLSGTATLAFADKPPQVLDGVAALGFPRGGALSLTEGKVSALNVREQIEGVSLTGLIQFTAPVTEGSSGGPVIDRHGAVIGLVEGGDPGGGGNSWAVATKVAAQRVTRWKANAQPPSKPDCPDLPSLVTVVSKLADGPSLALTLELYFGGIDVGEDLWPGSDPPATGYEVASDRLDEGLHDKYPSADALENTYAGTRLDHVTLEKADTNGQLEDWADVSWNHYDPDGICERHKARFTLRLDSGWWKLTRRVNAKNPASGCVG